MSFEDEVIEVTEEIAALLIEKNRAYGDSALNPLRVFSKADTLEQLCVRMDDKLSRLARGSEYPGDDTITDLLGYLIMYKIQKNRLKKEETVTITALDDERTELKSVHYHDFDRNK